MNNTWILVASSYGSKRQSRLKELRDELKHSVRHIVDKYGWDEKAKSDPATSTLSTKINIV